MCLWVFGFFFGWLACFCFRFGFLSVCFWLQEQRHVILWHFLVFFGAVCGLQSALGTDLLLIFLFSLFLFKPFLQCFLWQ